MKSGNNNTRQESEFIIKTDDHNPSQAEETATSFCSYMAGQGRNEFLRTSDEIFEIDHRERE
jgi:hypothetical protein